MKPLAQKAVTIRGERWVIRVLSEDHFAEAHGDCAAITLIPFKTIEIPKDQLTFVTVLHEVFHAYSSYLHLDSAQEIVPYQVEEIMAELFSNYGVQMIKLATDVIFALGKRLRVERTVLMTGLSEDQQAALAPKPRSRRNRKT